MVHASNGQPCAVAYEHGGLIVHSDKTDKDFDSIISSLNIGEINLGNKDASK